MWCKNLYRIVLSAVICYLLCNFKTSKMFTQWSQIDKLSVLLDYLAVGDGSPINKELDHYRTNCFDHVLVTVCLNEWNIHSLSMYKMRQFIKGEKICKLCKGENTKFQCIISQNIYCIWKQFLGCWKGWVSIARMYGTFLTIQTRCTD